MALAEKMTARPHLINDYEFMTYASSRGRIVMLCEDPPIYVSGRDKQHATRLAVDAIKAYQYALTKLN